MTKRIFNWSSYFYLLVGAAAGVCAWLAGQALIRAAGQTVDPSLTPLLVLPMITVVAGVAITAFERHRFGAQQSLTELGAATLLGVVAGAGLALGLRALLAAFAVRGDLGQLGLLFLVGAAVGAVVGIDVYRPSARRVVVTAAGGVLGSAAGGALFLAGEHVYPSGAVTAEALGWTGTLALTALGAALAPAFRSRAGLEFVTSSDPQTSEKYRGGRVCHLGDGVCTVGSSAELGRKGDLYLPDPAVQPRHAKVVRKGNGWFLARHEACVGGTLAVNSREVAGEVRLVDGAEVRVGNSTFSFVLDDETPARATGGAR